jgi:hypothetical protein
MTMEEYQNTVAAISARGPVNKGFTNDRSSGQEYS